MALAPVSLWIGIFVLRWGMLTSIGLDLCRILVSWIMGHSFVEGEFPFVAERAWEGKHHIHLC